jgi:hypothetical protein
VLFVSALALPHAAATTSNPACGMTALAGATMLLDQFSVPEQTLTSHHAKCRRRFRSGSPRDQPGADW